MTPRLKVVRAFLCLLLAAGLPAAGACPASEQAVDPPDELGGFGVGHLSFTAVDPARGDRSLLIDVWYPVDPEDVVGTPLTSYALLAFIGLESEVSVDNAPASSREKQTLLVFSHGYRSINIQSTGLMETLASHGFIVASPEHTGNSQAHPDDSFDEAASRRVPDVSFVIDTMIARNRDPADPLFGRLDEERFGVVGNSFGAMTAVGMAAGWAGASPDPRVVAIAPVSGVFDGDLQQDDRPSPNAGFDATTLATIEVPVLLVGGTQDINVPIGNNELAFDQMVNAPVVYKVDVIGATHTHFANICDIGNLMLDLGIDQNAWPSLGASALIEPYATTCSAEAFPIEDAERLQNLYVVAFFRHHLLGEPGYAHYLTESFADTEPAITFTSRQLSD